VFSPYVDLLEESIQPFSQSGIVYLIVGIAILVVSNALAYLLVKSFNIQNYFGRFLGGVIILFITLLLSLSTNDTVKFRVSALFGIGEIIIGALDIISNKLSTSLPLLIPDPGCGGGNA
jgi:cadmium resistance protein CadD (predicted permease)